MLNDAVQYDGLRFRAECKLAGKIYGQPFGVDLDFGDPIFGQPDIVVAEDVLAFAGVAPPTLRLYPIETHIAEKLHAYTIASAAAGLTREGSARPRAPRLHAKARCEAPTCGHRADLHAATDTRAARIRARAARKVGHALCSDGA